MLRHETPSYPDGVGSRGRQRLFQPLVVEIATLRTLFFGIEELSGADGECFVGFAHEHGMTIRLGEQSYGAQRNAVLQAGLAGGMDKPHRGFAPIHNRNTLEFDLHTHPDETVED